MGPTQPKGDLLVVSFHGMSICLDLNIVVHQRWGRRARSGGNALRGCCSTRAHVMLGRMAMILGACAADAQWERTAALWCRESE